MDIDLSEEIEAVFKEYRRDVIEVVNKAAEKTAKEGQKDLRSKIGDFKDRTGKYRKSWRIKKTKNEIGSIVFKIYAKEPHYRLTHLLEFGHALKGGGRARAYPHISVVDKKTAIAFEQRVRQGIEQL